MSQTFPENAVLGVQPDGPGKKLQIVKLAIQQPDGTVATVYAEAIFIINADTGEPIAPASAKQLDTVIGLLEEVLDIMRKETL